MQFGNDARYFVERFRVLNGIRQHARKPADGERAHAENPLSAYYEPRAENTYDGVNHVVDEAGAGVDQCREESRVLSRDFKFPVYDGKPFFRAFFISEKFYDALIRRHFGDKPRKFAAFFGLFCERVVAAFCDEVRDKKGNRRKYDDDNRDKPVVRQHKYKRADNRDDPAEQLRKALNKPVRNLVDVVSDARHKVAVRIAVDIRKGHDVKFFERFAAKIPYRSERREVYAQRTEILEQQYRGDKPRKYPCVFCDDRKIDVVFSDDEVHGFADNHGREKRCDDLKNREEQGK